MWLILITLYCKIRLKNFGKICEPAMLKISTFSFPYDVINGHWLKRLSGRDQQGFQPRWPQDPNGSQTIFTPSSSVFEPKVSFLFSLQTQLVAMCWAKNRTVCASSSLKSVKKLFNRWTNYFCKVATCNRFWVTGTHTVIVWEKGFHCTRQLQLRPRAHGV